MNESLRATKKEIVTAFRTREILAAARSLLEQRGQEETVPRVHLAEQAELPEGRAEGQGQGRDQRGQGLAAHYLLTPNRRRMVRATKGGTKASTEAPRWQTSLTTDEER